MNLDQASPIELDFKSIQPNAQSDKVALRTFDSYFFERNILVPASPFRFTAPGVSKSLRTQIRSGDWVFLFAKNNSGVKYQLATGFVDETDTHILPNMISYGITGRDTLGQLVDNTSVDLNNIIINTTQMSITGLLKLMLKNTRIPQKFSDSLCPTGVLLIQTNPGETKINTMQRYLEPMNCLIWTLPDGSVRMGKPNFSQASKGLFLMNSSDPSKNNCMEARSKRAPNQAIRQIVTQLQTLGQVSPAPDTINNQDSDVKTIAKSLAGRSVYEVFSYGQGESAYNQIEAVGQNSGEINKIGSAYSRRQIARENMKVLDVEIVVQGHFNSNGEPYNIDQIYNVQIEDDDVSQNMYVYYCAYELTKETGMITRMRLCNATNTIVDNVGILPGKVNG